MAKKIAIEQIKIEAPYELPEGWKWTKWGEIGKFIAGNGFKEQYQGFENYEIPFYKVGSLKNSDSLGYLFDKTNTINESIRSVLKATLIPVNSIIFAKIGEAIRLNRRCLNSVPCCIDNNLMAFFAEKCDYKFVFYWSKYLDLYSYTNATTVPAIRKSDLENIPFPLPPTLAEQQRIVNRIEKMFEKLDQAQEKAQAVLDSFETRKAAILHKAFSGQLRIDNKELTIEDWEDTKIGECLFPMTTKIPTGTTFRYIDIDAIDNKIQEVKTPKVLKVSEAPSRASRELKENDVLFSMVRPYLKNIAFIDKSLCDCIASTGFYVCRCKEKLSPLYLYNFLCSKDAIDYLMQFMKGDNSPSIRKDDLLSMPIKLPPLNYQLSIVNFLDTVLEKESRAKEAAQTVLDQIALLKKSILARAFRGEL